MTAAALFLSYDGLTGQIGQSQVLPYVRGLAARGHGMSVLSFEAPAAFERLGTSVSEDLNDRGIAWIPRRFRSQPPLVAKAIDQADFARSARRLVREGRIDIAHCRSYIAADVGLALKRRFGTRFLFDMRGFWVDERREGGRWTPGHPIFGPLYRRWKRKEADFIAEADAIVVLAEAAKAEIESWSVWQGAPITVIPCSLDLDLFTVATPERRAEARCKLDIAPEVRVLVYLGSLGTVYLLAEMIAFFAAFRERHPGAVFLFLGQHDPADILRCAREHSIELRREEMRILQAPHAEVPFWLGAADLGIGFRTPTFSSKGASPTKLGEYLAAGLPVVVNDRVGDVRAIVERFDAGHVVRDFAPGTLAVAVEAIGPHLDWPRENLRARARDFHDVESAVDRYDAIYRRLLGGGG